MPDESQEKTEQPTAKRKGEAREEGNVARSTEVNSAMVLLAGTITLYFVGAKLMGNLQGLFGSVFRRAQYAPWTVASTHAQFLWIVRFILTTAAPVVLSVMVVGLVANVMQVGLLFTLKPLTPKLDKLSPMSGLKRLASPKSLAELIKGLLKIAIIGCVCYLTVKGVLEDLSPLMDKEVGQILVFMSRVAFRMALRTALALVAIAILDYAFQRWQQEKQLRMTSQEVKEERKETEGNPEIRGRVRSIQREMAMQRMMSEVPQADVIITNPTHLAIALRYEVGVMVAPVVLAKGERLIAERIKEIAREHQIPIVEDRPLARALYESTEVGMEIPEKLYKAVAGILSYIYKLNGKGVPGGGA